MELTDFEEAYGFDSIRGLEAAGEEFTEALWASLVEKVTVYKDGLAFSLTNGEEVRI